MAQPDAVPSQRARTMPAHARQVRRDRPTPELLRGVLGRALRRARQFQCRTLSEVARSAQISMAYLSELERGRKEASSEVLAAVCAALGIDLAELLSEVLVDLTTDRALPGRGWAAGNGRRNVRLGLRDEFDPRVGDEADARPDATASLIAPARLRMLRLSGGGAGFPAVPPSAADAQCRAA